MSAWTKERLEQMIADGVEENLSLDYKRADALDRTDGNKFEITKDVSAFANSAGGVLIYGIAEPNDKAKRHLPERLDPVRRVDVSKEWLEQVIQTIQPRVEGVVIHPVTIDEQAGLVCYVVEVPQSHTAHQARDHVYHQRLNFNVLPMEDHRIREVMNRKTHPKIRASIFINRNTSRIRPEGIILVKIENVGHVLARNVMAELEIPLDLNGQVVVEQPLTIEWGDDGGYFHLKLVPRLTSPPLFVGSTITLLREFNTQAHVVRYDNKPTTSTRHVKASIFADEMPPIRATLDIAPVLLGWTPILSETASST